ncbi:hypothetical protein ScPMuIL_016240 [Solemya velum]
MRFYETDIYQAILNNDSSVLKELISGSDEKDFLERDWDGRSYLHLAVDNNVDPCILELLLQRIDITMRDENGYTCMGLLHLKQLSAKHTDVMTKYISRLFLTGRTDKLDYMLLHGWEAWPECPPDIEPMLSQGVIGFLKQLESFQEKLAQLHAEICEDKWPQSKLTMDIGLFQAWDRTGLSMGRSMLHYAAVLQDSSIYDHLIKSGASTDITDITGNTPLDYQEVPDLLDLGEIRQQITAILARPKIIHRFSIYEHTTHCGSNPL